MRKKVAGKKLRASPQEKLPLGLARLKKLADHLMKGKLGHKEFAFAHWNIINAITTAEPYTCGYAGCAIGECPIVFPKSWAFCKGGAPLLRENRNHNISGIRSPEPEENAAAFFHVCKQEAAHLFAPYRQEPSLYGGKPLYANSTKEEVAANIYAFIKLKMAPAPAGGAHG